MNRQPVARLDAGNDAPKLYHRGSDKAEKYQVRMEALPAQVSLSLSVQGGEVELIFKFSKCVQCNKESFVGPNSVCLKCLNKNLNDGKYDHIIKGADNKSAEPPTERAETEQAQVI